MRIKREHGTAIVQIAALASVLVAGCFLAVGAGEYLRRFEAEVYGRSCVAVLAVPVSP
jgi:hypothetical protein